MLVELVRLLASERRGEVHSLGTLLAQPLFHCLDQRFSDSLFVAISADYKRSQPSYRPSRVDACVHVRSAETNNLRVDLGDISNRGSAAVERIESWRNLIALGGIAELPDEPRDYLGVICGCFAYRGNSSY